MNQAVEEFNRQLSKTIELLEREENMIRRRSSLLKKTADEERIMDEIKRYT